MGWRTVVVNSHSKLNYKNNHLVYKSSSAFEMIHLSEIDVLLVETTDVNITTMLLKRLTDEGILVIFCDDKRLPKSILKSLYGRHDSSLQIKKQISWDDERKDKLWQHVVSQKILNQSSYLRNQELDEKADDLLIFESEIQARDSTNREGHAARTYFNALFGNDFTRDTENDLNAALNYGYTLVLSVFSREIVRNGCMTQIGINHANQFNDFNFASDLMEPFRTVIDEICYENRDKKFNLIKKELFNIFSETYLYNGKSMFLNNIIREYVRSAIKYLHQEDERVPVFRR